MLSVQIFKGRHDERGVRKGDKMKVFELKKLGVKGECPEDVEVVLAALTKDNLEICMSGISGGSLMNALTSLFSHTIKLCDAPGRKFLIVSLFASIRERLWEEGLLGDNVDIAVSLDGKVLPLDEIGTMLDAVIKKDR